MAIESHPSLLVESSAGFFRLTNTLDDMGSFVIVSVNRRTLEDNVVVSKPTGLCLMYEWVASNNSPRQDLPSIDVCIVNHAQLVLMSGYAVPPNGVDYCLSFRGRKFTTAAKLPNRRLTAMLPIC